MDIVLNANLTFIISTVSVFKIVKDVQYKHQSTSVKNVKADTCLIIPVNVFKLSTDLIGTLSIWTFSHLLIQPLKRNLNKYSQQENSTKSTFNPA